MTKTPTPANEIPKPTKFFLNIPLYSKTLYEGHDGWKIVDVLFYDGTYDSYCPECRRDATFKVQPPYRDESLTFNARRERVLTSSGGTPSTPPLKNGLHTVTAVCTRHKEHVQYFTFLVSESAVTAQSEDQMFKSSFEKIGQYPSYGELHIAQIKRYAPVTTQQQLSELSRAIGLASHDVGVGAYVYLRRIFESLIEEAHQLAKVDPGWDDEAYMRLRMTEKIASLKKNLPEFLTENPKIYGLLSKGVHELSEEECLKNFETLRLGIELILDEKLEENTRIKKIDATRAALQKAVSGS